MEPFSQFLNPPPPPQKKKKKKKNALLSWANSPNLNSLELFSCTMPLRRAVSRARTWIAAACWGVFSSDSSWHPALWVESSVSTRQAGCHHVSQAWNIRQFCQQNQRTRACHASRNKLRYYEGIAIFGNRKLCWIYTVACAPVCIKHCYTAWLWELLSTWIIV